MYHRLKPQHNGRRLSSEAKLPDCTTKSQSTQTESFGKDVPLDPRPSSALFSVYHKAGAPYCSRAVTYKMYGFLVAHLRSNRRILTLVFDLYSYQTRVTRSCKGFMRNAEIRGFRVSQGLDILSELGYNSLEHPQRDSRFLPTRTPRTPKDKTPARGFCL